ncbi:hypothetical protein M569_13688 [Genlisea aurea]|uniref:Las1-like family protein n=1 Tax=Genlisea aurea TaxID=192259 RepID=S8C9S0_9LAMI|nr:hypothetical protein M569_13688 [Genlisea aurea]
MMYCMAILRLVNGVVEKTRKRSEFSIAEAADAISIPRMLIDIRHDGSHHDLPSLQLLQLASQKAVDWLIWYYWEPQEKLIPVPDHSGTYLRKDIKRCLREIALQMKGGLPVKGKSSAGAKRAGQLRGGGKFLFHAAVTASQHNSTGSKRRQKISKLLNNIISLYSSSPPEVLDVLLEYLLNALDSRADEKSDGSRTAFDGWISVVSKLSRRKPGFLLCLTQAVLEKLGKLQTGDEASLRNSSRAESLSTLLECLTGNLKKLYAEPPETEPRDAIERSILNSTAAGLLRKCLSLSSSRDERVMSSALILAELKGDVALVRKLEKLASISRNSDSEEAESSRRFITSAPDEEEHSLQQAAEMLHSIKKQRLNNNDSVVKKKWVVTKSWNPCPIGMLPHDVGFSGRLPILDHEPLSENQEKNTTSSIAREREEEEKEEDPLPLPSSNGKTTEENSDFKGHLLIDGTWKRVGDDEVVDIASSVRLLVG